MNLNPYEFEKAKEGDLFIKKGKKLVAVSFFELSKEQQKEISKIAELEHKYKVLSKSLESYKTLVKSYFISVFSLFELKALKGEIDVADEELLNLDEKVLNNEMSVEEALSKHDYLQSTYNELFGKVEL